MNIADYFPQGIAEGPAFIGRVSEMAILQDNIESGLHTLIIAPRRFGKTSLVLNVLSRLKMPYVELSLYLAISEVAIAKKIIGAIEKLLKQLDSTPERLLRLFNQFIQKTQLKIALTIKGAVQFELGVGDPLKPDPVDDILAAFKLVDHILEKEKKRAVFFLDEIQEMNALPLGKQLQGAIREFAQQAKQLTFVFSGSNRHMLLSMFDDKSMPLYELCEHMTLGRIDAKAYQHYLVKVAKKTMKQPLSSAVIEHILSITHRHPRRINNLCLHLWRACVDFKRAISTHDVDASWMKFVNHRLKEIRYQLKQLNKGQLKILTVIALGQKTQLTGKEMQRKTQLTSPTITRALMQLEDMDYIERTEQHHVSIIDPLIETVIKTYEYENIL